VNKKIYDNEVELPENYKQHLTKCFQRVKNADQNSEGYKRNQELQNQKFVGYPQLKRIKNFFDNFKGNENNSEFILNGGFMMKNWVDSELRKMREFGHLTNTNKMETGMQNQFIDPHEKKDFTNVRPSKKHQSTIEKYDTAVTESLRRINELITKI
jgi:hypothetical protein